MLDVLKMRLVGPQPEYHHPENWLMEFGQWERSTRTSPYRVQIILQQSLTPGPELLGGMEEKIAYALLQQKPIPESLALVRPEALAWQIEESSPTGRRRTRAVFTLAGMTYNLPLTDPFWRKRLANLPEGCYPWEEDGQTVLLTISLSEPFDKDGFCYKLVAAVITLPPMTMHAGLWNRLFSWFRSLLT